MTANSRTPSSGEKEQITRMNLPWTLETMGALLAQPCYSDAEARTNLRENPKGVVAAMAQGMDEAVKAKNAPSALAQMGGLVEELEVVVHEDNADTWNIVIPSEEMLELEADEPWLQDGALTEEALDKVSGGELVLLATGAAMSGGMAVGTAVTAALLSKIGILAVAAVGATAAATAVGAATAGAISGALLTKGIAGAAEGAAQSAGKRRG